MTLKEAIKYLSDEVEHPYSAKKLRRPGALKLGIEAMERLEQERSLHTYPAYKLLPSETEE